MNTRFAPTTTPPTPYDGRRYVFQSRHNGECRTYYKRKRASGGYMLWCLQWDGEYQGVNLYNCTPDGEPEAAVGAFPMRHHFDRWEWPAGSEPKEDV